MAPAVSVLVLVVGPAGVFLLDSKNWFGDVTVADGVATVTPRDNPDAAWSETGLARRMRGMSAGNKEALKVADGGQNLDSGGGRRLGTVPPESSRL